MPVQLTLRSPKGGRVLHERTYDDGYRIDAVSGWLVAVDRNGSVVAAHAACPGLEGAVVEHASAAATPPLDEVEFRKADADGVTRPHVPAPPLRVADMRDDEDRFADELIDQLGRLGDTYGPLSVAIAAATLTDPQVLVRQIVDDAGGAEVLQGVRPPDEDPPDGYEANLDALRAEVARLSGHLDEAESRLVTYRREVDEQTARAEREYVTRLRVERMLDGQQQATIALRGHLDAERARAEEAEATIDLYRRHGPVLDVVGGQPVDDPIPHEPIDLRPVAEDPRRPHPDAWPDDAALLTYAELRRLVSLHLDRYGDARSARAMLNGDVPLRLSEVLT